MKILIAPNAFKESLSAVEITSSLNNHFNRLAPGNQYNLFPLSDGGDGFIDVISFHKGYKKSQIETMIINGGSGVVEYIYDEGGSVLFMESASVIGLKHIPAPKRNVLAYDSYLLGACIHNILSRLGYTSKKVEKIIIGVGGTATIDLGLGAATGLSGLEFHDSIVNLNSMEVVQAIKNKGVRYPQIELILDVSVNVLGERDMVSEFGAQKGVKPEQEPELRKTLDGFLNQIFQLGGKDYHSEYLGAGGGLAVGFDLLSPVKISYSEGFIWEFLDLKNSLPATDIVISSEGRLDKTSLLNKATAVLISKCREFQKPLYIICGSSDETVKQDLEKEGVKVYELKDYFKGDIVESIRRAGEGLQKCAGEIIGGLK